MSKDVGHAGKATVDQFGVQVARCEPDGLAADPQECVSSGVGVVGVADRGDDVRVGFDEIGEVDDATVNQHGRVGVMDRVKLSH